MRLEKAHVTNFRSAEDSEEFEVEGSRQGNPTSAQAGRGSIPDHAQTVPMLDHFSPAAWLIRNPKLLDGKSPSVSKTLDRAEKIFGAYNKLL